MPYRLAALNGRLFDLGAPRYLAVPLWAMGAWIIIHCSIDMVRRGHSTPAHIDPPAELVITGLYRHVRNPIYLGALLALLGHITWSGSGLVIAYFLCYVAAFHILIVFFEEPVLRKKFGSEYDEYRHNIPHWIPRVW